MRVLLSVTLVLLTASFQHYFGYNPQNERHAPRCSYTGTLADAAPVRLLNNDSSHTASKPNNLTMLHITRSYTAQQQQRKEKRRRPDARLYKDGKVLTFIQMRCLGPAATLFVNGEKMASVYNWHALAVFKTFLKKGDVISVHAKALSPSLSARRFGILLDVRFGRSRIVSGMPHFHAVAAYQGGYYRQSNTRWMHPGFQQACKWPLARSVRLAFRNQRRGRVAFVWARNAKPTSDVFIRTVLGGLQCKKDEERGKEQGRGDKEDKKEGQGGRRENNGRHNDNGKSSRRCRCQQTEEEGTKRGRCFYFTGVIKRAGTKWHRTCTPRKCFPKFECVGDDVKDAQRCIRKYAYFKVRPVRKWFGKRFFCKKVRLSPPRPFLVPYE